MSLCLDGGEGTGRITSGRDGMKKENLCSSLHTCLHRKKIYLRKSCSVLWIRVWMERIRLSTTKHGKPPIVFFLNVHVPAHL